MALRISGSESRYVVSRREGVIIKVVVTKKFHGRYNVIVENRGLVDITEIEGNGYRVGRGRTSNLYLEGVRVRASSHPGFVVKAS